MQKIVQRNQLCELARQVLIQSAEKWGESRATVLVGRHPLLAEALDKTQRCALSSRPVLINGETGVGKESFARALYLSSQRSTKPFIAVNCAQYQGEQLVASQLFGHRKGSFTGAVSNYQGVFQEADGGVVFLDEIGDLSLSAQAMVLRVIGEGEVVPIGSSRPQTIDVKLVSATNRDLRELVAEGRFREDLYYRLCGLTVDIPPLRDRGRDWELIADYYLALLAQKNSVSKRLAPETRRSLDSYHWPGNVRELLNLVDTGFHMSCTNEIKMEDLGAGLEETARFSQLHKMLMLSSSTRDLFNRMREGESFWDVVYEPYMRRDLNRSQVQQTLSHALCGFANGSYKRMLLGFGVEEDDYHRAMDFLRHHDLKPGTGRACQ